MDLFGLIDDLDQQGGGDEGLARALLDDDPELARELGLGPPEETLAEAIKSLQAVEGSQAPVDETLARKVQEAVNRIGRPVFCPDCDKSGEEHYVVLLPTSGDTPAFHLVELDSLLRTFPGVVNGWDYDTEGKPFRG
jgi:hypothetical protein